MFKPPNRNVTSHDILAMGTVERQLHVGPPLVEIRIEDILPPMGSGSHAEAAI